VVKHSLQRLKRGVRRRYLCKSCRKTFCSTTGTAYHKIQKSRRMFDWVVSLRMEGGSIASISRLTGLSWNTVARWLARAAEHASQFNDRRLRRFELLEVQADEMRTFVHGKDHVVWIYTAMEVSSRLWPVMRVGRRGYHATMLVFRNLARRALPGSYPLIATDGYRYYKAAVRKAFGGFCVFGQVMKSWRKNRVTKVNRIRVGCTSAEMEAALERSEDSTTVNTSFIERMNLVIRQGLAYLSRKTAAHARSVSQLTAHLELFRCFYNFVRPHSALRFGNVVRTPAQQAQLVSRKLTWRDIFSTRVSFSRLREILRPGWRRTDVRNRVLLVA
jgi:IS1 family transposase